MKLAIEHLKNQLAHGTSDEARAQAEVERVREELEQAETNLAGIKQRNADFAELYEAAKLGKLQKPEAVS